MIVGASVPCISIESAIPGMIDCGGCPAPLASLGQTGTVGVIGHVIGPIVARSGAGPGGAGDAPVPRRDVTVAHAAPFAKPFFPGSGGGRTASCGSQISRMIFSSSLTVSSGVVLTAQSRSITSL
jgi:hypothetical protein